MLVTWFLTWLMIERTMTSFLKILSLSSSLRYYYAARSMRRGLFFVIQPRSAEWRETTDPCDEIELALARLAMRELALRADRYAAQMEWRMTDKKIRRTARTRSN